MQSDLQMLLLSQEQQATTESLGELRRSMSELLRRLEKAEQELATLKAAHQAHVGDGTVTATPAVVWEGVP